MNILIAEDAHDQRLMLRVLLEKMGHAVVEAEDGLQALDLLTQPHDIDIVLSDWRMPNLDGMALCEALRGRRDKRYLYFILLTGHSDEHTIMDSMERGADDFVRKPVDVTELGARLKAAVRILKLKRELEQKITTIENDLNQAAATQRQLLPTTNNVHNANFAWTFEPSRMLGGDMFGYQSLDGETVCFYQLDVAGHGVPSALLSFSLNHVLRQDHGHDSLVKLLLDEPPYYAIQPPARVLERLNERFQATVESMNYFTMAYGLLNDQTGELTLALAGHPAPLWIQPERGTVQSIPCPAVPIGMMPQMSYQQVTVTLAPNDLILFYSDGLTECENPQQEQFGVERLQHLLQQHAQSTPAQLNEAIRQATQTWADGLPQEDDVSFLLMQWTPNNAKPVLPEPTQ